MRLSLKSTLVLLVVYAVLVVALAFGTEHWLRHLEEAVTANTVELLAREQTALLAERSFETLASPDSNSRRRISERIHDLTLLSEVVSSITLVDAAGKVAASDELPLGQQLMPPASVFVAKQEPIAQPAADGFLRRGNYRVYLPLSKEGVLVGYLQVAMHSDRIALIYEEARVRLLFVALAGLAGVFVTGALLQTQLSRRALSVARALEAPLDTPGAAPAAGDEFAPVLHAASRMREALDEAQERSSRLQRRFGALGQVMNVGVLLERGDGGLDFANDRAVELLGCTSVEQLKARWPEARRSSADEGGGEHAGGEAIDLEIPTTDVPRRLRAVFHRLGDEGEGRLVLLNDPRLLDALETDARLASQLEGLARVYRTAAHELRAPLSAMMINLDLLRETLAGPSGQPGDERGRQERYVGVLRDELTRLNRSLHEMLTSTVPSSEEQRKFDLRALLEELGTLLAPQARRQRVDLALHLDGGPVTLIGHPDRLKQAFLNVLVNALEAMADRGGKLDVRMSLNSSRVGVAIRDTGPGIPRDVLARIYELDFSTKGGGSGIGLCVARSLVELHGGQIRVESESGRGTAVEVELPLVRR